MHAILPNTDYFKPIFFISKDLFIIAIVSLHKIFAYIGAILPRKGGGKLLSEGEIFLLLVFSERTAKNTQN